MRQHCPANLVRSQCSAVKVIHTVFWDAQRIILLDFLDTGATVNSERYIKKYIKLMARIACTRSEKKKAFFLQHNNASHMQVKTWTATAGREFYQCGIQALVYC